MNRRCVLLLLVATGCLSSNPPLPPVRWFDPTPAPAASVAGTGSTLAAPVVVAAPHLQQPFALRLGEREFVFDEQHQWVVTPDRLVAAALEQRLFGTGRHARGVGPGWRVTVQRFEIDLTAAPAAVVELRFEGLPDRVLAARVGSDSRDPAALTAAMAAAIAQVCEQAAAP